MSEKLFWSQLNRAMRTKRWDAERINNSITSGFPDVSYGLRHTNGFIELKYLFQWPKDPLAIINFGRSFETQREWLYRRDSVGDHCYLFLWVKMSREWLLVRGQSLPALPKLFKRRDLEGICIYHWHDWIDVDVLAEELSGQPSLMLAHAPGTRA